MTKCHMIFIYLQVDLKYDTNELICETEMDSQTQRAHLWLSRARDELGVWN